MNSRRYIGALIIILTFLGVASKQSITIPNQEIVLQFTDVEVSSFEAKNTVEIVKQQLRNLGADNIQIKKGQKGTLKITYYSDADVASIKETLSNQEKLVLNAFDQTQNKEDSNFPLD